MSSNLDVVSALDLGEPPQEILDWAKKHIHENPDTRDQVIQDFRDMIFERGECVPHRTDDAFLLRFLRGRNFMVEKAHSLLVNYYKFKEENPNYFKGVNLQHLIKMGEDSIITVPPYREQHGRRILLYRMGQWNIEKFTIDNIFQASLMVLELAILEPRVQILGGICIFDLEGLTLQHTWFMTPAMAHRVFQIMVTSFPMKTQALHVVNNCWIFDMIFCLFKPLLDEKMKARIFIHGSDMESLHKHIDPKHLPERYGGVHPDYNYNDWLVGFEKNENIKKELKSLGYEDNLSNKANLENDKNIKNEKE